MKEIRIVIDNEEIKNIVITMKNDDDTQLKKVIPQNLITEKETKFISDLETLIIKNYAG